jgi:hypothetical protein
MQRAILLLSFLALATAVKAQDAVQTTCYSGQNTPVPTITVAQTQLNWDWRTEIWDTYIRFDNNTQSVLQQIRSPFWFPGSFNLEYNPNIESIRKDDNALRDFKPEDGWELLYRSFGAAGVKDNGVYLPSFALYNRLSGRVRVFAWSGSMTVGPQTAKIGITFGGDPRIQRKGSAMFGHLSSVAQALSTWDKSKDSLITLNKYYPTGSWWYMAEFVAHFDPCICKADFVPFVVDIQVITQTTLTLVGTSNGSINQVISGQYPSGGTGSTLSLGSLTSGLQNGLNGYNTWSSAADKAGSTYLQLAPIRPPFSPPTVASWIKPVAGIFGAALGLFDFFSSLGDAGPQAPPPPMMFDVSQKYNFTGLAITQSPLYALQVNAPGSDVRGGNQAQNTFYRDALGVFNFVRPVKMYYRRTQTSTGVRPNFTVREQIALRFEDAFQHLINAATGHDVTQSDITASLYIGSGPYPKGTDYQITSYLPLGALKNYTVNWSQTVQPVNPATFGVRYPVIDSDDPPYVYLKVAATFRKPQAGGPTKEYFHIANYPIELLTDWSSAGTAISAYQTIPDSVRLTSSSQVSSTRTYTAWRRIWVANGVTVPAGVTITARAGEVIFQDGSTSKPGFVIQGVGSIVPPSTYPPLTNAAALHSFCSTQYSPLLSANKNSVSAPLDSSFFQPIDQPLPSKDLYKGSTNDGNAPFELSAFPNPNKGSGHIQIKGGAKDRLDVWLLNAGGATVRQLWQHPGYQGDESLVPFTVEGLAPGLYFIKVDIGEKSRTIRVIVQ